MKFNDDIHGEINLLPVVEAIIKTSHFQRLLQIKQLGCLYKVYNEGTHTRYHHCIGTYYLAGKFLSCLERNTNIEIPSSHKDCVMIAGLLHDVGHGPFSHLWEHVCEFDHEDNGAECVDDIANSISRQHDLGNKVELIKALIKGHEKMLSYPIDPKYRFLFEIVHNRQCEIDVDKWDYLKRDAACVNSRLPEILDLDFDELFTGAKVSEDGAHIEYKYEHFDKIYNLFKSREVLHIQIYQTPKAKVLENILIEAIRRAESKGITFRGKQLSNITNRDQEHFLQLTDENVLEFLNNIEDPSIRELMDCFNRTAVEEIKNAREIIGVPEFLTVRLKIEHAGEKMKEERINFYGNPMDKPQIQPMYGFYEETHYFRSTLPNWKRLA